MKQLANLKLKIFWLFYEKLSLKVCEVSKPLGKTSKITIGSLFNTTPLIQRAHAVRARSPAMLVASIFFGHNLCHMYDM